MRPTGIQWQTGALILLLLAACTAGHQQLNSERIRQAYGSYAVEILHADERTRLSSLYSGTGDSRVCRTLAMVEFASPMPPELAREHAAINAGGSIGEVFRNAGWTISKESLDITETLPADLDVDVAALMKLDERGPLATYVYQFNVRRAGHTIHYATITEIYHPDYQTLGDLTANRE